ncbi:MAG: cell division protein FtsQ [Gallionellales bacterium GWA2_60_18]|nr:MAG: cell division protein FtsQ [Gallionellales bacterium GWA2_60_18]
MWDNAPLLRNIANALVSGSVLALLYGAVHHTVHRSETLPLRGVQLEAAPQRIDTLALRQVLRSEAGGNFFTVDIERLRQSLEKLPWVRSVSIRREFPDRLMLSLEEHQPLARWNHSALVNTHGEVFDAESAQPLPDFIGQQTGDAGEIAQRYGEFDRQLAALKLRVAQIALTPRHAWQLRLSNGMVLELGHEDMQQRLARFVTVYPYSVAIAGQDTGGGDQVKYVDLRYRNGFAIRG